MKNTFIISVLLLATLSLAGEAGSVDGFEKIHCGPEIPKTLLGQRMSNEKVAAIEERHRNLGLKDLGATEVSDRLSTISWLICGNEYVLLQIDSIVTDVLQFPAHSKTSPAFSGACALQGRELPETVLAVLEGGTEAVDKTLAAKTAWKIDEKGKKFVAMPTDGLRCPRDGIFSVDGGL